METVATDAVLLVEFVGNGIHISLGRHGLMESSVEDTHLGQSWHQFLHGVHALQVGGVMQRSQIGTFLEGLEHLVGKDNRLVELLSAVHHAVTHGINFRQVLNHANLGIGEQREDELHALCMLGDVVHNLFLFAVGELHFHKSAIETHALSASRCHHALVIHVVKRIFYRTAATVKN